MRSLAKLVLEGVLVGASTIAGVRLMQAFQDPYSDLRLRGSEAIERLREVTSR
jgi:hypothetical protein